jgi:hypothetical protein
MLRQNPTSIEQRLIGLADLYNPSASADVGNHAEANMRLLLAVCVLISGCVFAQEVPLKGPNRDPNPDSTKPQSYQGCVIRANGQVMLTDASNNDYKLVSTSGRSLDSYVGQEVRITAVLMNADDPSSDEKSASGQESRNKPATLEIEDIAKVADHCSSPK